MNENNNSIPTVAHAWCNLTLKEVGRDDYPVSMTACSRPGRICYRPILKRNTSVNFLISGIQESPLVPPG